MELNRQLQAAQEGVHAALCDNIDTQATLQQLGNLITAVNKYLAKRPLPHGTPPDGAQLCYTRTFHDACMCQSSSACPVP